MERIKRIAGISYIGWVVAEILIIPFVGISALLDLSGWWPWKWDQYPTCAILVFASLAAYTLPLMHMSEDRQEARERKHADQASTAFASRVTLLQQQREILQMLKDQKASQADETSDLAKAAFCAYMSDPTASWEKVSPHEQRRWAMVVSEIRRNR